MLWTRGKRRLLCIEAGQLKMMRSSLAQSESGCRALGLLGMKKLCAARDSPLFATKQASTNIMSMVIAKRMVVHGRS